MRIAASAAVVAVTWRSAPPSAPGAVGVPPNPPATIAGMERFMAVAMRLVRIVPDAPTIIPATIIAVLSSARPAAAAESPVNAFSREITTGMSAPPIGSTTITPSARRSTRSPTIHGSAPPIAADAAQAAAPASSSRFTACCARPSPSGRPGRISWSLPNATSEPQNDTEPTTAPNRKAITTYSGSPANASVVRNSDQAIRATAPPPTPLNSATICGIAVIRTRRADGTPSAAPITSPTRISSQLWRTVSSVASTATSMPSAAILLPRTAVRGPVSPDRPRMNSANATM